MQYNNPASMSHLIVISPTFSFFFYSFLPNFSSKDFSQNLLKFAFE